MRLLGTANPLGISAFLQRRGWCVQLGLTQYL